MEFKNIKKEVEKYFKDRLNQYFEKIKTEEGLKSVVFHSLGKRDLYKGSFEEQQKKTLEAIKKKLDKEKEKELNKIKSIEEANNFKEPLVLTIEWKKSNMWVKNPRVYTNKGFMGSSIGGCGYCKSSTATAEGLNSDKTLLKELFKIEEKRLKTNKDRRTFINYGLTYGFLPLFAGGVGVESHRGVIEALGLKWERTTNTPNTDVFIISR